MIDLIHYPKSFTEQLTISLCMLSISIHDPNSTVHTNVHFTKSLIDFQCSNLLKDVHKKSSRVGI